MNRYNRFLNPQGESVNICDPLKRTPLHVAASEGQALKTSFHYQSLSQANFKINLDADRNCKASFGLFC